MKIAVTGARGRLGSSLLRTDSSLVALDCNCVDVLSIKDAYHEVRPDVVINCVAYSDVDGCEKDQKRARQSNSMSVVFLRETLPPECQLFHISTSYIFDGKRGNYTERDRPKPEKSEAVQCYGFTKWIGEEYLRDYDNSYIIRTVGLYGYSGDFVHFLVDRLSQGKETEVSTEVSFNPTFIPHLSRAIITYVNKTSHEKIINIAGKEILSRYEFALMVADVWGLDKNLVIPTKEVGNWVAQRPKNAGLNTRLAEKRGVQIHGVLEGLHIYKEIYK